ncbi:MAG: HlyD family efflux transporter periplasmic adaptor subunit [Clostridia bacterium]|nr:HlyD family efflux transporter periplasmic adaptor subunit [Clostridia bacterium]
MQQTPVKDPMNESSAAVQEQFEQSTLEETLTFAPEKKGKLGKTVKRIILWGLLAAVIAAVAFVVYTLFFKKEPPPEMMTATATYGTIESKVQGSGSVTAQEKQDVPGLAKGEVIKVFVAVGDHVEVGQPLFTVNDEEITRSLSEYESSLKQANKNLQLVQEEIAAQDARAPFSGKTLEVNCVKGQQVSKGEILGTLVDDSKMTLTSYYSIAYINDVYVGQSAEISIPTSMSLLSGAVSRVERISKITDEGAMLFEVELQLDNPGILTKGMMATAVIHTANGDVPPAESSTLAYLKEEYIKAGTSGEITSVAMRDYYSFHGGDQLFTIRNEDLDGRLAEELKLLDNARKNYDTVAEQYQYYAPTAEIAGQVVAVNIMEGDVLTGGGNAVVSVADLSRMMMDVEVDEMYVSSLVPGMPVKVSATYDGGAVYDGILSSVSLQAKVGTGMSTFPAKIEILNAQGLMSGMWLDFEITTNRVEDCLVVPSNAVKYVENGTVCFVREVQEWHTPAELDEVTAAQLPEGFSAVMVETGASDAFQIEIVQGLSEGDEVATTAVETNPYGMYY